MNWINKSLLAFALLPKRLYTAWGVDAQRLTAILRVKLTMDDRRPNTIQITRQYQNQGKEIKNSTVGMMLMSGFMGMMYLLVFMVGSDYITQLTLLFGMYILMLCMMLVSDFTSVLIDVKDNLIILPKPVNDATVVVARLLHVFIHICKLVIPMCLPSMVYLGIKAGPWASLVFLLVALFATLFAIFLINAVYILILRVSTPERFKNIISYIQIVFAIVVYASSQLLPRMTDSVDMEDFHLTESGWLLFAPPYWFAAGFNTLATGQSGNEALLASVLALVVPLISIYGVVKYLAPAFNQKLAMISGGETVAEKKQVSAGPVHREGFPEMLARWLTNTPVEHTGFLFTWKMMARSRDFKVKVYPSIGYLVVIIFLIFYRQKNRGAADLSHFMEGFNFIIAVYLSSLVLLIAIMQMVYSDKFKAAWMYYVAPVRQPGQVIAGAVKATLSRFFLPLALVLLLFGLFFAGPGILPNLLFAMCNQLVIAFAIAAVHIRHLPFSQPFDDAQKGEQFMRTILFFFVCGLVGVVHFFVFRNNLAIGIAFILSALVLWYLIHLIKKRNWEDLAMVEDF